MVAYLALFVALGGSAYAFHLGKNSVGSKQLKKNAVTTAKVKNHAITAAKVRKGALTGTQIDASTLGTVPRADTASTATTATALAPPEAWHEVGAPGEPSFENSWEDVPEPEFQRVAFYKDHEGVVHLRGGAIGGSGQTIFRLPPGFRPTNEKLERFLVGCAGVSGVCNLHGSGVLVIFGSGVAVEGQVRAPVAASSIGLGGITFRAES